MMTYVDVARLVIRFPGVTESVRYGHRTWQVGKKGFAWERPFSKADIKRFGAATPPAGEILAVAAADLHEKESMLAANPGAFFTIPHFNGYPAILVQLSEVNQKALEDVLLDGWLACAPAELAAGFLPH